MAVETTRLGYILEKLKPEDPWLPPRPWESIPSESGLSHSSATSSSSIPPPLYHTPIVSEASLIRLAINALQGMESALLTIEKLCTKFDSDPSDRTFHRTPNIWKRTSSTLGLGRVLKSIGRSGFLVFLLRKFVDNFENLHFDESYVSEDNRNDSEAKVDNSSPRSLVSHAFSVVVRKLLEGCIAAFDTLYESVKLRRSSEIIDISQYSSIRVGCLTRSEYSEVTLLEIYLHSKELRTQIEVIGSICKIRDIAFCFSGSCLEDLVSEAKSEFGNFPRGGDLLTYLYSLLSVADPVHHALLKFLFLRSCEPYCEFIRSWIYKAEICDPYNEFMVEYVGNIPHFSSGEVGSSYGIWLAAVKERDGVVVPYFLKDMCIPIFRAGQQLQVLMKLLELSGQINIENFTYSDILPCWSVFSSEYSSDASPFSFNRKSIEFMAVARSIYYRNMMSKMDIILENLRTRFQQGTLSAFKGNCGGSQEIPFPLQNDDESISLITDKRDAELIVDNLDDEVSDTSDEFSHVNDQLDSSECSSLDDSEEQNESVPFIQFPRGNEEKYLSALELLPSSCNENSLRETCNNDTFDPGECSSSKLYDIFNENYLGKTKSSGNHSNHEDEKPNLSWFSETGCRQNAYNIGVLSESSPYWSDNDQFPMRTCPSSNLFNLPNLSSECHSNPLSMNPLFFKSDLMGKREKKSHADQNDYSPSFDFLSVKDPCKIHEGSLPRSCSHYFRAETKIHKEPDAYAAINSSKFNEKDCYAGHETLRENNEFQDINITSVSENNEKEISTLTNVCGGSKWESMLSCLGNNTMEKSAKISRKNIGVTFEMPLDFVIEKCLVQEILHQYWYISKLTIKLLEEGFNLREHLSALRRYHFMERADWADLFIVSLCNRKWYAMEVDSTVTDVQRLLAISLQKSSCEKDNCKDRLFVYLKGKGNDIMPLPKIGIDTFNFLGLGYKVDWPISIVLTPGALEIYGQIFSFLLKVKLAFYSLTDTWCVMKGLLYFNRQSLYAKARKKLEIQGTRSEIQHLNTLTTVRHQVNHFVTTLQQYVQSQLSHVSYCRFTESLNNKVKDMMDLESVHMAYLTESLHICFLSDEMKVVGSIIRNILQCALDLRSCLVGSKVDGQFAEEFPEKVACIDISQVLAVTKAFKKNLTDLRICFLKAPKQRELGLAHFWGFLNFNEHYSDFTDH